MKSISYKKNLDKAPKICMRDFLEEFGLTMTKNEYMIYLMRKDFPERVMDAKMSRLAYFNRKEFLDYMKKEGVIL